MIIKQKSLFIIILVPLVVLGTNLACTLSSLAKPTPTPPPTPTLVPTSTPPPTNTPLPTSTDTATPLPTATATPNLVATQDAKAGQLASQMLTKLGLPVDTGNLYWVQDTQATIPLEGPDEKYYILDNNLTASDFVLSTDITWHTDSWPVCGLWFRANDFWDKGDYYQLFFLRLSGLPAWDIEFYRNGNYLNTVTGDVHTSSFLSDKNDATNRIVLSAVGDEFKVFVNGNFEGRYYDYDKKRSSGKFAFVAKQNSGDTNCSFNNTWIWLYK